MSGLELNPVSIVHLERRARLAQAMGEGVAIIPTAPERIRNRDAHYPYRSDSYFHYLTGFPEPEAVLVVVAGNASGKPAKHILFCRTRDAEREIWDGFRYGPERAQAQFGFDETYPISELDSKMPALLADQPRLYVTFDNDESWAKRVMGWMEAVRAQARSGVTAPTEARAVQTVLDEMRLFKDVHELEHMRRAAQISIDAHKRAMRATRPGAWEYEVEAELLYAFRHGGAQAPAYTPIVAGGANACVLHYVQNDAQLRDGDLLLIDAAGEVNGYASDITRTFPVNGKFSGAQRDMYELVLAAQAQAIAAAKPGAHWNDPHEAAVRVLAQGFIDFGLCQGSVDAVIENNDYRKFYMHRTGHWLGLDVHDVGEYKREGAWRTLEPGMALTVEPGAYIRPADDVPEQYWNIGVRIEDDVVITAHGNEVLTQDAPKTVADIEHWMRG